MPKKAKELSARAVDALKAEGRFAVGGVDGLHLLIAGNGRSWILRVKIGARRTDIGLGSSDDVSLADARDKAREYRRKVREGVDPLLEKREARAALQVAKVKSKTFEECAEAYIDAHKGSWKNDKHIKQWGATLESYAYGKIGALPVASIETAHVLDVLQQPVGDDGKPLWEARAETASRLRGRIECVLDSARAAELRHGENPARWNGHLKHLLGKRQRLTRGHHAALPYAEIGAFMPELAKRDGTAARAVAFTILTAARSGEVRNATWNEIDLKARRWTIPAERMKAGKEHVVPLSDAAVAILEALPRVEGTTIVFAAPRGGALSDMSLSAVLKRMERSDITVHGFRSTFREFAAERTNFPRDVAEHALAHQLADRVEAAYQRKTQLPQRVKLMDAWAKFCATPPAVGNVVAIRGAA